MVKIFNNLGVYGGITYFIAGLNKSDFQHNDLIGVDKNCLVPF